MASNAIALAVIAVAALIVANVRAPAEAVRSRAKEVDESFLLPPIDELRRGSLGYRSALADYLWAHVLVTQGLRLGERRRFETITDYLDAITSLDEDFREPYLLADALTTMQAKSATMDDIYAVRRLLEKGARRFPNDPEIWLALGQFVVYVAPISYMKDQEEAKRWRLEGAEYLGRAAALGSEDAGIAWRAIGGVRSLQQAGEREATIRFYRRALAVTSDPELREDLERRLGRLLGDKAIAAQRARREAFEGLWHEHFPATPLGGVFISPPPFAPGRCAGGAAAPDSESPSCARTWADWTARIDSEIELRQLLEAATTGDGAPPAAPPRPPASAP